MSNRQSRGIRRNNPGNIEYRPSVRWQGQVEPHDGDRYAAFVAPQWGIRAIARVLVTYEDKRKANDGSRIDTVHEFISRWAPSVNDSGVFENDTGSYVKHMSDLLDVGPNDPISVHDYDTCRTLVVGIITHENGYNPYSDAQIAKGLMLAGMEPPARTVYQAFRPEPKPLRQSRSVQGGATAVIGAGGFGVITMLEWLWGKLDEAASDWQIVMAIAVMIGCSVMIYGYWKARQEGRVDVAIDEAY